MEESLNNDIADINNFEMSEEDGKIKQTLRAQKDITNDIRFLSPLNKDKRYYFQMV